MIGVWTGCGYNTIPVLFPPVDVLGYDACVPPIVDTDEEGPRVLEVLGPPEPSI
jgi:hypothetical protein